MKYKELVQEIKKYGFQLSRQAKGSHEIWKDNLGRRIIIANHGSREIPNGLAKSIIKKARGE